MKKYTVWSSEIDEKDFEEFYKEYCEESGIDFNIDNIYEYACEMNNIYLCDERMNLNIDVSNGIVALADIGRWNGRIAGYKEIGNNISDCLYSGMDGVTWFIDEYGKFCADMYDHDGRTHVIYKAWKDFVTDEQKEKVLDMIYCRSISDRTIRRYMRNIGKDIANIYGWKVRK